MTGFTEDRVESVTRRLRRHPLAAAVILVGLGVIALATFTEAAGRLAAASRVLLAPDPLKGIPSKAAFQEWAIEYGGTRSPRHPRDPADDSRFDRANSVSFAAYAALRDSLYEACVAYRRHVSPNLYVDLPDIPEDVFGRSASQYRGGITFSRYCSWGISLEKPAEADRTGPTMRITFMDGDGSIRGGSEVGSLRAWYDFEAAAVQLRSVGVVAPILEELPSTIPEREFGRAAKLIAKLLVENQISSCTAK